MKDGKLLRILGTLIFFGIIGLIVFKYTSMGSKDYVTKSETAAIDASISQTGETLLLKAIRLGDVEEVKGLLNKGASISLPEYSLPLDDAINWAAGFMFEVEGNSAEKTDNQKRIISLLVDAKAPTKQPEIFVAILREDFNLLKEIIKRGDIKKLSKTEMQQLPQIAIRSNNKEIMEYLKREIPNFVSLNPDRSLLYLVVGSPYYSMIEYVLSLPETNVNALKANNDTALHETIGSFINPDKVKTIKALLAKGAKINALGYMGKTPLDDAESIGDLEIIKLLIDNGAKKSADLKG